MTELQDLTNGTNDEVKWLPKALLCPELRVRKKCIAKLRVTIDTTGPSQTRDTTDANEQQREPLLKCS